MNAPKLRVLAKQLLLIRQRRHDLDFPPPREEELASLLDDQIDFNRKQQIYAYLNTSPELMQQWVDLIEARHDLSAANQHISEEKKTTANLAQLLFGWLSELRLFRFASSAAVLVVAVTLVYVQWPGSQQKAPFNTINPTNQIMLDQSLVDFLADTTTECITTLEDTAVRNGLYVQLLEVRDTYTESSFSVPISLLNLSPKRFGSAESACQFIAQLTQDLSDE
jgi:hypothetical protein